MVGGVEEAGNCAEVGNNADGGGVAAVGRSGEDEGECSWEECEEAGE